MAKARRPVKSRKRAERRQWLVLAGVIVVLIGPTLYVGREVLIATTPAPAPGAQGSQQNSADDEIYTGSILFMPQLGSTCRQYLFDNTSGRMSDNGMVDCDHAAYHPVVEPPKNWTAPRLHIISSAFRER
jgi:hypothetical protein